VIVRCVVRRSGLSLFCVTMLVLVPGRARAEDTGAWISAPTERKWAALLGVTAGLTTFAGVAAAVAADAYRASAAASRALPDQGPLVRADIRADAHSQAVATKAAIWLFGEGAALAGATVALALVQPRRGVSRVDVGLSVGGLWLVGAW
jgi:hypothetical protein